MELEPLQDQTAGTSASGLADRLRMALGTRLSVEAAEHDASADERVEEALAALDALLAVG